MNSLFRYIFLFVVVLTWGNEDANAQANNLRPRNAPAARFRSASRNPKLEAAHERFIGQQLNLTDSESARFWPVYRKYQQELTAVRILKRLNNSSAQANGTEQIDKEIEYDNQMVNIRKHYRDEFLKILPAEKVSELYKSERQFTDELFKQLSERSIRAGN
ncbi:hypothetical protein FPZ43_13080 [Mucilaginibacter pallidiroseus]|uniref:Uncharacterized protein n=1 Tax=Mucilaginibacter pallidiroseus TaxID=2599295 RepID=A0A563U7Y8_9SPHI|nr:hypothetical protein [Mucilaginibacter pallidiroseus]TWR27409.1 hypothetical protein FPZ43_13080 [Mucilaginibacter pallidiroseus]